MTPDAATAACVDKLIASGWSVRQVRIGLQVIGMLGPAACLLLAVSPVVGGSPSVASALITVGLGFSALTLGGVSTSHLDIAPKHAGGRTQALGHACNMRHICTQVHLAARAELL